MDKNTIETDEAIANLIGRRQAELGVDDATLARKLGYSSELAVRMITSGAMKLPTTKVYLLAQALGVPPDALLHRHLEEDFPEMLEAINECMGATEISMDERQLIMALREIANNNRLNVLTVSADKVVALVTAVTERGDTPGGSGAP